jgi:CheY-like chemotaxis protein
VLVVEDTDEDVLTYQRLFDGTPYQVVHAQSMEIADQLLHRLTPSAVVLDVQMHDREAWDLLVRLRGDHATTHIPVVVVSAADHRRKALGLGATAFAMKPVPQDWLLHTLDAGLRDAPIRVLTIDDEETFRYIVREILAGPQFELAEAVSAEEGLAMLPAFQPDVVLLDLQLPALDGFDVAERLAREAAHLPIIVVTSQRLSPDAQARLGRVRRVIPKSSLSRDLLRAAIRDAVHVAP